MFVSPKSEKAVLDTFKMGRLGIFLKDFHILRTHAAFLSAGIEICSRKIETIYNFVEKENLTEVSHIGRLVFEIPTADYNFQIFKMDAFKSVVKLQPILNLVQPLGIGAQNYKWVDREFWDKMKSLKSPAADDVLSRNEKMQVVETSRFNLFFYDRGQKTVFTPPLSSGCIQGVYRQWALTNNYIDLPQIGPIPIFEKVILFSEINQYQIFVANSVRGVLSVELIGT